MDGFGVHCCPMDAQCRRFGTPKRLYLFTPWGYLIMGERTQGWLPFVGSLDPYKRRNWWPVVFHPK